MHAGSSRVTSSLTVGLAAACALVAAWIYYSLCAGIVTSQSGNGAGEPSSVLVALEFARSLLVASALAYVIAPVVFFLNLYYCFTVIPKHDRVYYPSKFATVFSWVSLIVFTGMTGVLIWVQLL
jgi:hypothetical protein